MEGEKEIIVDIFFNSDNTYELKVRSFQWNQNSILCSNAVL